MNFTFHKVATLPGTLVAGGIYFETSTGLLYVATSTSAKTCVSGVQTAALAGSTLTITKFDGTNVTVDIATLAKNAVQDALDGKLNIGSNGDASSVQSYYGLSKKIDEVQASVASVYKPKGSIDIEGLKGLSGVAVGDVYNITDGGEIEEGLTVKPGDNVAALKAGAGNQADMWDVLAGTVDLSDYVTTSQLTTQINTRVPTTRTVNSKALSANIVLGGADIVVGGSGDYAESTVQAAIDAIAEELAGAIAGSVSSFGGQTGAITVDTTNNTAGQVKFAMSGKNLTGTVNGWANKVDTTRTINSKPLSANVVLGGADIEIGGSSSVADSTIAVGIKTLEDKIGTSAAWATWE